MRFLLSSRGLSLADVARQSDVRFRRNPLFRIPSNFYDALRRASFSPSFHQLYALSALTGYRLVDWAALFGLSFDDAARFQASQPRYCTAGLDTHLYDPSIEVAWFDEAETQTLGLELTPLSRWLIGKTIRPLNSLSDKIEASFRYLKIGSRDVYPFWDLLPGSIARIATDIPSNQLVSADNANRILAIQHRRGIFCSRVRQVRRGRIVLCSGHLPYAPLELTLGTEAEILGHIDLEIRRVDSHEMPEVRTSWRHFESPRAESQPTKPRIGEFLREARIRSGFSLREASERTAEVAHVLRGPSYFCAPGTLSDLEARDQLPRHIHKWISLSGVYCVPVAELAARAGLPLGQTGKDRMPEERTHPGETSPAGPSSFLSILRQHVGEIPFFLYRALSEFTGLPNPSVRDLFWTGATSKLVHPYLRHSLMLAINRKSKSPAPSLSSPIWAQPLYVLELRSGKRLCAACSLERETLTIRPCSTVSGEILRLRHRTDVEVLGKVVAIVRRL